MGFYKEVYNNNRAGLTVMFSNEGNSANYFSGDSVEEALAYFNMYISNGQIYVKSEDELALEEVGISSVIEATQLRTELNDIISTMTDEEAIERPILFSNWTVGKTYSIGERVRYAGRIFKVLQNHTSQADWTPSRAPSLFAEVLTDESGEPQEWRQPDSTNPYLTGDKVIYNGLIYESLIDNNVWAPDVYTEGWKLISNSEPEQESEISDWVQPDATTAYKIGDKVRYNEHIYESTIDNNVWSPDAYPAGWTLIE